MSVTQQTAQAVSPLLSGIEPIGEVPIERCPGHPVVTVGGLTRRTSISVALPSGAFGSQITPELSPPPLPSANAEDGVTIRKARVKPGPISGGLGHFWIKRSFV